MKVGQMYLHIVSNLHHFWYSSEVLNMEYSRCLLKCKIWKDKQDLSWERRMFLKGYFLKKKLNGQGLTMFQYTGTNCENISANVVKKNTHFEKILRKILIFQKKIPSVDNSSLNHFVKNIIEQSSDYTI